MLDAVNAAYPLLVRARVLDAVTAAVRRHDGPVTSAEARAETAPPVTRSAKAFAALARKVAGLEPDESGRRLVRAGTDPDGVALWTIEGSTPAEPRDDHAAQLDRVREHLLRLGLARPDEAPLAVVERLLEAQPTPPTAAPEPCTPDAPEPAPLRNEPAPLAQVTTERAPEIPHVPDTSTTVPLDLESAPHSPPPAPPARDDLAELFGVAPTSPTDDDTAALRAALE